MSRMVAILAPEIGELKEPLPMLVLAVTSTICGIVCLMLFLQTSKTDAAAKSKAELKHQLKEIWLSLIS